MRKYRFLFYILVLSLLLFPRQIAHGEVTTGDANSFSCTENLVGTYGNYLPWFNDNCITPAPQLSVTPCPSTITPTPTTCPNKTFTCEECLGYSDHNDDGNRAMYSYCKATYNCDYKDEKWSCDCEVITPTQAPTATPTQTPSNPGNSGGPGDGRSDGRSDGLSSCPSCTKAPAIQAVLGLSTTSGSDNVLLQWAELFGALALVTTGAIFFKKNA